MALPIVYVFCNAKGCTGSGDWHNGMAIAEDGTALAGHVSSNHYFLKHDLGDQKLGYPKGWTREEYGKHYPDGYEVKWLEGAEIARVLAQMPKTTDEVGLCPQPGCDGVLYVFTAEARANRQARGINTPQDTHPRCSVCDYIALEADDAA